MIKSDSKNNNGIITGNHETIMNDLCSLLNCINSHEYLSDIDSVIAILQIIPKDNERVMHILKTVESCSKDPLTRKINPFKVKECYDLSSLNKEEADAMEERIIEGFKARNEYKK
jgi:hypothetical protein